MMLVIAPCPKCGSIDCRMSVTAFEIRQDTNRLLKGEWPCEWSDKKRYRLLAMLATPRPSTDLDKVDWDKVLPEIKKHFGY